MRQCIEAAAGVIAKIRLELADGAGAAGKRRVQQHGGVVHVRVQPGLREERR